MKEAQEETRVKAGQVKETSEARHGELMDVLQAMQGMMTIPRMRLTGPHKMKKTDRQMHKKIPGPRGQAKTDVQCWADECCLILDASEPIDLERLDRASLRREFPLQGK